MKMKKVTQKDRYGNQISYEYEPDTKPLDITSLFEKLLDKDIPEYLEIPESPVGGSFTAGFAPAHPGEPRGQDTVPAWLTPGEFVVNREGMEDPRDAAMVEQINNKGRAKQMAKGGMMPQGYAFGGRIPPIHYEDGGSVPVPMSPTEALLRQREGFRSDVYLDSLGKPTVGHGHLLPEEYIEREGETPFTDQQLDQFFYEDQETAEAAAKRNAKKYGVKWDDLNRREQTALTSMAFQLGETGQGKFENMWTKLAAGDKQGAALEALDSAWAGQTPQRAKDVHDAFTPGLGFNAGGPIYAYRGIDVAQQDAFDIEDPNADLSAGWTPPVYDENEISPMEQAILDEEALAESQYQQNLAQQIAMAENMVAGGDGDDLGTASAAPPPVEEPPQIQDSITEDMGLLGKAIDWFGGPSDIAQIEHEERGAQQLRGAAADKEQEIAGYEAKAEELEAEANAAINAGDYAEYARLRKLSRDQKNAADAATAEAEEIAKAQTEQEAAHAANQALRDDISAAEKKRKMLEAIAAAEAAGDTEAVEVLTEEMAKGTNEPGPEDDITTLESLATSPEFEEEDNPSKPSDKGQQHPPEVEAKGKEMAKEDPGKLEKAKDFFKGAFSDLFDGKELARMAIMYMGSRALGYSHGGSLNWAAKQYVQRLDAKSSSEAAQAAQNRKDAFELEKAGKHTPASVAAFAKTGDLNDLVRTSAGTGFTPSGTVVDKWIDGKKVSLVQGKTADGGVAYSIDGKTVVSPYLVANAPDFDAGIHDKNSSDYKSRRNDVTSQSRQRFEEISGAEDVLDAEAGTRFTNIHPRQAADEYFAWAERNGLDAGSAEMQAIMGNAYRNAIQDSKDNPDRKASSLVPYLESQMIRERTTRPELFQTGLKDGRPTYVDQAKMAKLDSNVNFIVNNSPRNLSADNVYGAAIAEWSKLEPDVQAEWNSGASKGTTGFFNFMQTNLKKLGLKANKEGA